MQIPAWVFKTDTNVMTPEQHITAFDKTINDLKSHYYGQLMVNVGIHANKMIFDRVHDKGIDAEGAKYRPYSTKAMLVGCKSMNSNVCSRFFGKENNKKHEWRTVKGRHLAILPGGYKQFREMHNRQTNHVDFSFSGEMWAGIKLISNKSDHDQGVAKIGALEAQKKKLEGNTKSRGDILDLSRSEQDELIKTYNLSALQIFKNNGL
jgi:hypothetical protein